MEQNPALPTLPYPPLPSTKFFLNIINNCKKIEKLALFILKPPCANHVIKHEPIKYFQNSFDCECYSEGNIMSLTVMAI